MSNPVDITSPYGAPKTVENFEGFVNFELNANEAPSVMLKAEHDEYFFSFMLVKIDSWDIEQEAPLSAETLLHGNIKYDGCSNIHFDEGCIHSCSQHEYLIIGRAMPRLWDMAKASLGAWDGDDL